MNWEAFWGFVVGWVVVAICTVLIAAAGHDGEGRTKSDHPGPVPANVTQLSASAYLIPPLMDPDTVCGRFSGSVDETRVVRKIEGTYVSCAYNQTWNSNLPPSLNYGTSLIHVAQQPYLYFPLAGFALLLFVPWGVLEAVAARRRRASRTAERAEEARKRVTLLDQKRELVGAWSRNEIPDQDFEKRLSDLYDKGLEREEG